MNKRARPAPGYFGQLGHLELPKQQKIKREIKREFFDDEYFFKKLLA
jgi:hypothetical protein